MSKIIVSRTVSPKEPPYWYYTINFIQEGYDQKSFICYGHEFAEWPNFLQDLLEHEYKSVQTIIDRLNNAEEIVYALD